MIKDTIDEFETARRDEYAAKNNLLDIGVGKDICAQLGWSSEELSHTIYGLLDTLINGGANRVSINGVQCYIRRRGNLVDAGSRKDFSLLGWEPICDVLDSQIQDPTS